MGDKLRPDLDFATATNHGVITLAIMKCNEAGEATNQIGILRMTRAEAWKLIKVLIRAWET